MHHLIHTTVNPPVSPGGILSQALSSSRGGASVLEREGQFEEGLVGGFTASVSRLKSKTTLQLAVHQSVPGERLYLPVLFVLKRGTLRRVEYIPVVTILKDAHSLRASTSGENLRSRDSGGCIGSGARILRWAFFDRRLVE